MRQEIIRLYDDYTHERLDRRVFMDRLAALAGGTAAASALLPLLQNNYANAAIIAVRRRPPRRPSRSAFPVRAARSGATWRAPPMPAASCRRCW